MAICHGCGGGGGGGAQTAQAQGPAPAAPAPPTAAPSANRAPTISGQAAPTVQVGASYVFQPTAADPDGDALSFSAENLPPWASLNPTTGQVTGTPGEGDVGAYEAITITVADAARRTATQPFTITVVGASAGGTGVASLRWETPPSKVDGSPLDDLAGYRIVYGRNADDLDQSIVIDSPTANSYEFATLDSGVWYFAVIAVNASGLEGPATSAAMKSI